MIQRKEANRTNLKLETWFPWLTGLKAAASTQHMVVSYAAGFSENVIMLLSEMESVCLFIFFDIVD